MSGQFSFRTRFIVIGLIFLVGYAALIAVGAFTLERVRIGGGLYEDVVEQKDLIADILPPPKFIVEPHLLCYEIATADTDDERRLLIADLRQCVDDYNERQRYWEEHLEDPELRTLMLETSHAPAQRFFEVMERDFLPVVLEQQDGGAQALQILVGTLDDLFAEHRAAVEATVTVAQTRINEREATARSAIRTGRWLSIAMALVFIAIAGLAGLWVARSVLGAMDTIIGRMREMAEADANLSARLTINSNDEVGELARWFNALLDKFSLLVRQVRSSSVQLTSTATQVAATSRYQEETINSLGASTNQVTAATHEISATGAELLSTMQEVRGIAQTSSATASEGRSGLAEMEATMTSLVESSASISSKLAVINDKTRDIASVVTTINKVADQTNLLSVNAAIEAEKAGEYGRGFLIVAREIRRLADQTASATLDIEDTVNQMQSAVSAGVMEMDKFSDQVRHTVDDVSRIGGQLGEIIGQVEDVSARFETVNDGMATQASGVRQINDAMVSLSDNVQKTLTSLGDFTAAAEGMRDAVGGMRHELDNFKLAD